MSGDGLPDVLAQRSIRFSSLSELMPEVCRLRKGSRTIRRWTFAQICGHIADTLNGSIDGFTMDRHRLKRRLVGGWLLKLTFAKGIPENYTVDARLSQPPDERIEPAIERLRSAVDRYTAHDGPMAVHPLFGRMTRAEWDRLHCVHAAHHLGFVRPIH